VGQAPGGYYRCSGYRGIPVHLLLGPFNGPASAQGRNDDQSQTEKTLMRRRLMRRTTAKTAKDQKTSSRAISHEGRDHIHVSSARFRAEQEYKSRRLRTVHATPDRKETCFRRACIKWDSGCWPPPKNRVDGAGRQRRTSASSTHSCGPVPLLYEDYDHGRFKTTAVLPPWPYVATPSPR
jgi:hypothetical protein